MRSMRVYGSLVVVVMIACSIGLLSTESILRWYDGYQLFTIKLTPKDKSVSNSFQSVNKSRATELIADKIANYLNIIPLAPDIDRDWYYQNPLPLPNRTQELDPEVQKRYRLAPLKYAYESSYVWNYYYLKDKICRGFHYRSSKLNDFFYRADHVIYYYKPRTHSTHPAYRYLPNRTYPGNLVINQFGFRGPPLSHQKPQDVIRLAFLGASTTVGAASEPYSYPEYIQYWLTLWASKIHFPYRIEVINAGRSGISSPDIAEVMINEVLPLAPDYLFYYEGSNQFYPKYFLIPQQDRVHFKRRKATFESKQIEQYSALARRYYQIIHGRNLLNISHEPRKPDFEVRWPKDLNEQDPDIFYPNLPVSLNTILADLDKIRLAANSYNIPLVPMSFVWLPYAGMQLEGPHAMSIYWYLNRSLWPFKYGWIRRIADFQNRVFRKYAQHYGLDFIDVDAYMPRDPLLFTDGIHNTADGTRLRAWIVLQDVVKILNKQVTYQRMLKSLPLDSALTHVHRLSRAEAMNLCTNPD